MLYICMIVIYSYLQWAFSYKVFSNVMINREDNALCTLNAMIKHIANMRSQGNI